MNHLSPLYEISQEDEESGNYFLEKKHEQQTCLFDPGFPPGQPERAVATQFLNKFTEK
jgi:hypothetical protein